LPDVIPFHVALIFLLSGSPLFAQETFTGQGPGGSEANPPGETTEDEGLNSIVADSVRSMFQERESPLLHIRWGAKVYVDIPLGNEPADASLTLRKAELKLSRAFGKNFQVKLSGNYLNNEFKAGDSYLVYTGWKAAILTAGVQDPPFSLEASSSSSAITFMEDALPVNALSENKNAGVDFLRRTSNHILNASWVFYNPRQQGVAEIGQALVGRYVYSPIHFYGRKNIHLGGSFSYRFLNSNAEVQLQSRPEVATADDYYVNTGNIDDGKVVVRAGLEASQVNGRFSWQSELLASRVNRNNADTLQFWGAYFHLSQFLTNDSRNYDQGSGTFINVVPNSPLGADGWGAFELAFRASYVDLTDKEITGGRQSNLSLGLNWYLNEKLRLMTNLIKVLDVDRPGSEYDGLDPLIFALRAQWLVY
jgi:phosphate-selective porin OprO/OprP